MKNRDMPANPIMLENGEVWDEEHDHASGLTKREYAAIKIMAGFAGNADVVAEATELKTHAVKWADELFDELEKGQ